MQPVDLSQLLQFGAAGAVIAVVVLFLKYLKERDEAYNIVLRDFTAALNRALEVITRLNK